MIREPKFEFLPDRYADFPVSVWVDPWFVVLVVAAAFAIAGAVWRFRRR